MSATFGVPGDRCCDDRRGIDLDAPLTVNAGRVVVFVICVPPPGIRRPRLMATDEWRLHSSMILPVAAVG
jgi:hypothetical protein